MNIKHISKTLFLIILLSISIFPLNFSKCQDVNMTFTNINAEISINNGEITLYGFNEKSYLKVIPDNKYLSNVKEISDNRIEYKSDKLSYNVYEIDKGLEVEIILYEKPLSNIISFDLELKDLVFHYQSTLDSEPFPKDYIINSTHALNKTGYVMANRPINKVGSYAIYDEFRRNNEYGTGKLYHLDKPLLTDSKGNKIYADYNKDVQIIKRLDIIIPQKFLDTDNYPIIIDPTFFGYDTGGSTSFSCQNKIAGSVYTLSENALITSMSIQVWAGSGGNVKTAIYDTSHNLEIASSESAVSFLNKEWISCDIDPNYELSSGNYRLSAWTGTASYFYYDVLSDAWADKSISYNGFPDPIGWDNFYTRSLSIIANYTSAIPPIFLNLYFNNGGKFLYNGTLINNGSSLEVSNLTVYRLIGASNNNTAWLNFDINSVDYFINNYNFTIYGNTTIWCYFGEVLISGVSTGLTIAISVIIGIVISIFITLIFIDDRYGR